MPNNKKKQLDDTDWDLIFALRENPRISVLELSKKIGIHRNTITNRLQRESSESIIFHNILPNYEKIGVITAYILATSTPNYEFNQHDIGQGIANLDGVEEVAVISGEWDFIIKIRAHSMKQIGEKFIEDLRKLSGISSTITCITFWSFYGKNPFNLIHKLEKKIE